MFPNLENSKHVFNTVGVYVNKDYIVNCVYAEHLSTHIEYNVHYRWGRALFLNGKCIHSGYLSVDEIQFWEKHIEEHPHIFIKTVPNPPYK